MMDTSGNTFQVETKKQVLSSSCKCRSNADWSRVSSEVLQQGLEKHKVSKEVLAVIAKHNVSGQDFRHLTFFLLQKEGLTFAQCHELHKVVEKHGLWQASTEGKVINVPVVGNIHLPDACMEVIDNPQFQRLRDIKQMGTVYEIFPGAVHTKFEHALIICHQVEELIRALIKNDSAGLLHGLIDETDILCLQIAALCHDLGTGPFPHVFKERVAPKIKGTEYQEKETTRKMFDHMIKVKEKELERHGLTSDHFKLIKNIIAGPVDSTELSRKETFLCGILYNPRNSLHVKSWDSVIRDCHQMGICCTFDCQPLIKCAKVLEVDGKLEICLHNDIMQHINLRNLFSSHYIVNEMAYRHRINIAMELMIADAFLELKDCKLIPTADGKLCSISDCLDDMAALTELTENIIYLIHDLADSPKTEKAKKIIDQILSKRLYKCVVDKKNLPSYILEKGETQIAREIQRSAQSDTLSQNDFVVQILNQDHNPNAESPVEHLFVFDAKTPNLGRKINSEESLLFQKSTPVREPELVIYATDPSKYIDVKNAVNQWLSFNQMSVVEVSDSDSGTNLDDASLLSKLKEDEGRKHGFSKELIFFLERQKCILGKSFDSLTITELMKEGFLIDEFFMLQSHIQSPDKSRSKSFSLPIFGTITLPEACGLIIDTREFQRLRDIKQMGMVSYVYPGSVHTKFEHALGSAYLAGKLVTALQQNDTLMKHNIDDKDILCVIIGALCYDLGTGPFSHVFREMVVPKIKAPDSQFREENLSLKMFNHLMEKNNLKSKLQRYGLNDCDIIFIQELIGGPSLRGQRPWPYKGRSKKKSFLFEIIFNQRNSTDVKKWDTIARDCQQLGIRTGFDHMRIIKCVKALDVNGEIQNCIKSDDIEFLNLSNLFSTRYFINKLSYRHRVNGALELMVAEIMIKCKDIKLLHAADGGTYSISDCLSNMEALTELGENIIFKIHCCRNSNDSEREAKKITDNLLKRNLFKCCFQIEPGKLINESPPEGSEQRTHYSLSELEMWIKDLPNLERELQTYIGDGSTTRNHLQIVDLDFGMKDESPMQNLHVYDSKNPNVGSQFHRKEVNELLMLPTTTRECHILIYTEDRSKIEETKKGYDRWMKEKVQKAIERAKNASDDQDENAQQTDHYHDREGDQQASQHDGQLGFNQVDQSGVSPVQHRNVSLVELPGVHQVDHLSVHQEHQSNVCDIHQAGVDPVDQPIICQVDQPNVSIADQPDVQQFDQQSFNPVNLQDDLPNSSPDVQAADLPRSQLDVQGDAHQYYQPDVQQVDHQNIHFFFAKLLIVLYGVYMLAQSDGLSRVIIVLALCIFCILMFANAQIINVNALS